MITDPRTIAAEAMRKGGWSPHFIEKFKRGEEEASALMDLATRLAAHRRAELLRP